MWRCRHSFKYGNIADELPDKNLVRAGMNVEEMIIPNRSLGRCYAEKDLPLNSSPVSTLLSASCLPSRFGVAHYAFGEAGSQSAWHDSRISLKHNDRFGINDIVNRRGAK